MSYQVIVLPTADAEALRAFRWIADRSPTAAARWYADLEKAIAKLAKMPERHPIAEEESEQFGITIRQMIYGRRKGVYRILFSIDKDIVYLHRVRHASQDSIEP